MIDWGYASMYQGGMWILSRGTVGKKGASPGQAKRQKVSLDRDV